MENKYKALLGVLIVFIPGVMFGSILFLPDQVQAVQDVVRHESMHPCQKATVDHFNVYKKNSQLLSDPNVTIEEYEEFAEEWKKYEQELKRIDIQYRCGDLSSEWWTPEFEEKMQDMLDEGF